MPRKQTQKRFVLDTNILLSFPGIIPGLNGHSDKNLLGNEIILPIAVINELDRFKNELGNDRGHNARKIARYISQLVENSPSTIKIPLDKKGTVLTINMESEKLYLPDYWDKSSADNRIISTCIQLKNEQVEQPLTLISNDMYLRIRAKAAGIEAKGYELLQDEKLPPYTGHRYLDLAQIPPFLSEEAINLISQNKPIPFSLPAKLINEPPLVINEYVILEDKGNYLGMGRYDGESLIPCHPKQRLSTTKVTARNSHQSCVIDALMAPVDLAPLVIITGPAGTAKTFLSLACALEQVKNFKEKESETNAYDHVLVCRSGAEFDSDIGFLPGDEQDKIAPLMRPIVDNLKIIIDIAASKNSKLGNYQASELFEKQIVYSEAMNFMRGRSIVNQFILIDEAQNLTPRQAKGLITRVGAGSKIVLVGDPAQIDNPILNSQNNGLVYAANKMRGQPLCWQFTFDNADCQRSPLAQTASSLLD